MFEHPPTPTQEKSLAQKNEAFDKNWYKLFEAYGSFQAYEYFDGNAVLRTKEKDEFLRGEQENPTLDYPKLDSKKISEKEDGLLRLKQTILEHEPNETVRQLYRWRINEKLAENRLCRAAAEGNMKKFNRYSKFVYGKPSPEIFSYTVSEIRKKFAPFLESENQTVRDAAKNLIESLPKTPEQPFPKKPSRETIQFASEQTRREFSDIARVDTAESELGTELIREYLEHTLELLDAEGWYVEISKTSKSGVSVNQEEKKVSIPENRKMTVSALKELLVHEIGTHVSRRVNGERSRLLLLGLGLDRYEGAEEGIATMREQTLAENPKMNDFSGLDGHFAISLASGIDGHPRDFRGVFSILEKYFYFQNIISQLKKNGKIDTDLAQKKARDSAWNRCVRTFRGTNCAIPGTCFTKDIIYREGNIAIWDVISKDGNEMMRFNIGKYDPSNERHSKSLVKLGILSQLGITDEDLEKLESESDQ